MAAPPAPRSWLLPAITQGQAHLQSPLSPVSALGCAQELALHHSWALRPRTLHRTKVWTTTRLGRPAQRPTALLPEKGPVGCAGMDGAPWAAWATLGVLLRWEPKPRKAGDPGRAFPWGGLTSGARWMTAPCPPLWGREASRGWEESCRGQGGASSAGSPSPQAESLQGLPPVWARAPGASPAQPLSRWMPSAPRGASRPLL